jgi:putative DNA primase/helicase
MEPPAVEQVSGQLPPLAHQRPIALVLSRLDGVRPAKDGTAWTARCSAHDDRHPSLSVDERADGAVLLHCFAGCSFAAIVAALRLDPSALFPPRTRASAASRRRMRQAHRPPPRASRPKALRPRESSEPLRGPSTQAGFDYVDEAGTVLYQVVRTQYQNGKRFYQRRPDGQGGWIANMQGVPIVLYRLPELLADDLDDYVFIPEGEKHVDRLREFGRCATCNPMGAGKWRSEFAPFCRDRRVVILPDNDQAGLAHAVDVVRSLQGIAREVRVLTLLSVPSKGDILDFLDGGGTLDQIDAALAGQVVAGLRVMTGDAFLAACAPKVIDAAHPAGDEPLDHLRGELSAFGVRLSAVKPEGIAWLSRGRLAAGKLTMIDGDPGLGKSTVLLDWSAKITRGWALPGGEVGPPRGVVILSAEDGVADTIRPRAEAAGADLERIFVVTELPDGGLPTIPEGLPILDAAIREVDAALVIVDPLVAFLGDEVNANKDQDVRRALAPLKALAERTGVAVALIRHLNKTGGGQPLYRGGGSIGLIGAARFGMLVARDPDDDSRCLIAPTKANLSCLPPTLAYRLVPVAGADVARVEWLGESPHAAAALLAAPTEPSERGALDDAKRFLRELLQEGPHPVKLIKVDARDAGISEMTLRRAKDALGVQTAHVGFGKESHWEWRLSDAVKTIIPDQRRSSGSLESTRAPLSAFEAARADVEATAAGEDEPERPPREDLGSAEDTGDEETFRVVRCGDCDRERNAEVAVCPWCAPCPTLPPGCHAPVLCSALGACGKAACGVLGVSSP